MYDAKLLRLLAVFSVPASHSDEKCPPYTAVYRERVGTRTLASRCGPAIVLGFKEPLQRYSLDWGSNIIYVSRTFVKIWFPSEKVDDPDPHLCLFPSIILKIRLQILIRFRPSVHGRVHGVRKTTAACSCAESPASTIA